MLSLSSGWTHSQVAEILLIDCTTVRRYFRDFKKGGVRRLLENNSQRHRGYLSLSKLVPGKADAQALEVFIEEYEKLKEKRICEEEK